MPKKLAYALVGDHLGQVKKVLIPSGEVTLLSGCAEPSSSNPVVSIETLDNKQLIANKNGQLFVYDCIQDTTDTCESVDPGLKKALPISEKKVLLVYDKHVTLGGETITKKTKGDLKRAEIENAKFVEDKLAVVGKEIPLRIYDINKKLRTYNADRPEKDWLGIEPDVFVAGLDFIGKNRIATCSKSDSVIRIYDIQAKTKPMISIDLNQTAFNEHADSSRFHSVAATEESDHTIVVGSNVGQILAIDLRFHAKQVPKKKLQPRAFKVLGGFKGPRGASIKDIKIVKNDFDEEKSGHKVISCSLDRYLRIHDFTKTSRYLFKHVYMTTKPICCSPVFYNQLL